MPVPGKGISSEVVPDMLMDCGSFNSTQRVLIPSGR